MKRRLILGGLAAMVVGATAYTMLRSRPAEPAKPVTVPMMAPAGIPTALSGNYGFMSLAFHIGDVRSYVMNFADTGRVNAPRFGELRGRSEIAKDFVPEGLRLAVREFVRRSSGWKTTDRFVLDSGTYELTGPLPDAPKLDAKGRYWTLWLYSPDGRWQILLDSLGPSRPGASAVR